MKSTMPHGITGLEGVNSIKLSDAKLFSGGERFVGILVLFF
jgi:hypothetical protein